MENVIADRKKAWAGKIPKVSFKKKKLYKFGNYVWVVCRFLLIFGLGFVILYPLLQIISKVFMPTSQYQDLSVIWIPKSLTLDNIKNAVEYIKFWPSLANTMILGLSDTDYCVCNDGIRFCKISFPASGAAVFACDFNNYRANADYFPAVIRTVPVF